MRWPLVLVVGAVVVCSLSACSSGDDACDNAGELLACQYPVDRQSPESASRTPIPLSTSSWQPGDDAMLALITGRIALSRENCVHLQGRGGGTDVIWPAGYSADISDDGVLTVRNPAGQPVGHEGTKIRVAGGGSSADEAGSRFPDLVCAVDPGWVVYINDELPPL